MKIASAGGLAAGGLYGANRRPATNKAVAKQPSQEEKNAIRERMTQQNRQHLSFLTRVRQGMILYQEKLAEANGLIAKYGDSNLLEHQEEVRLATEALPEMQAKLEELQETLENGIEEHTFIMSTLEALLNGDGKLPVHTLEEYVKKKEAEQERKDLVEEPPRRSSGYTVEDLDGMIAALRKELGLGGLSVKA